MNFRLRKRGYSLLIMIALPLLALALGVAPALGIHNEGIFQLDGDEQAATCNLGIGCTGDDWDSLYSSCGTAAGGVLGCVANAPGTGNSATTIAPFIVDGSSASIFTGGGSKDEADLTQWLWKDSSVPDKDNLIEGLGAIYQPTSGPRAGHKILYFGANRLAVNGDAQIGVWFFQEALSLCATPPCTSSTAMPFLGPNGGAPHHQKGDVLILSNFTQGGGNANIQVYAVDTVNTSPKSVLCTGGDVETSAGTNSLCLTPLLVSSAPANFDCNDNVFKCTGGANADLQCNPSVPTDCPNGSCDLSVPADSACAATNGTTITSMDGAFKPKSGAGQGSIPPVGFFEGGLDLTAVGLGNECFPTFLIETRSSQSVTAVLKDFELGSFEQCAITCDKTVNPAELCQGSTPSPVYTYTVINTGPALSVNVVDDNATPSNSTDDFHVCMPVPGGACTTQSTNCPIALAAKETRSCTLPAPTAAGTYTNTATYTPTVGGVKPCTKTATLVIDPNPTASINTIPCNAANAPNSYSLTCTASGGTSPYSFLWTPGMETTATITKSVGGNFACQVTDSKTCQASATRKVGYCSDGCSSQTCP